jgi:dATP pyrophosphohydrolase
MRQPFQVLVIPFRYTADGIRYAVFKRSDAGWWQFVAGGGEAGETPIKAAERETEEEIGVAAAGRLIGLSSMATVPRDCFAAGESWGDDLYVVPEYCFAVEVGDGNLKISREHSQFRWVGYEEGRRLLKWDSNRNALWELNRRLMTGSGPE